MDNKNNKKNKSLGELFEIARRSITTYSDPISPPVKMVNDRSPVVELVNGLLQEALENNASDIHVEPGHKLGRLRYRIDGRLEEIYDEISMELYSNVISRIKIMCQLNIAENRLPQDGRFSYEFGQQVIDVRVSIVPLIKGEKVVMRLLNRSAGFMDIDSLDFSPENRERFIMSRLVRNDLPYRFSIRHTLHSLCFLDSEEERCLRSSGTTSISMNIQYGLTRRLPISKRDRSSNRLRRVQDTGRYGFRNSASIF